VLVRFARLAGTRGDAATADGYAAEAERLRTRLYGMWHDGHYPRLVTNGHETVSWFDALMGSWPVLSGAVGFERGQEAVETALQHLEREHQVLLLTPWFGERSPRVPGRIADYPPGVRENGGQYSHGSSWLVDALARLATAAARDRGDERLARDLRARAFEVWRKISPLGKTGPGLLDVYGLPPHQQPADIYSGPGPGYEGRGGWAWYTGAAARMLSAAHAILGLRLEDGRLSVAPDAFAAEGGELRLRRVVHRGRVFAAARPVVPAE
jgi:cyclic beta-1,2-glucan synthetase